MKELTYEEFVAEKKKIAQIIWDNPFYSGLVKLNKTQLIVLISALVDKLDEQLIDGEDCRCWKEIVFDNKCLMVEACEPNFFKENIE